MKFIITCGGSGGHINPGLSVARRLREQKHEVLFIGAPHGLERDLVPRDDFPIEFVDVRSFARSFAPKAIAKNFKALFKAMNAASSAKKILKKFNPSAVLGTGGYASYPALKAAGTLKIPTLVHDSNAFPGVTTKMAARNASAILVGMESCRAAYRNKARVFVVGTPVRPGFFNTDRLLAKENLRLDNRPLVVSMFGSQGARDMNRLMLGLMEISGGEWQHIHAAGPGRYEAFIKSMDERKIKQGGETGLRVVDYIRNMEETIAAADLLICRAGGSTLAELSAAKKPAILIPSPNVTADHQTANAKMLTDAKGAVLFPEAGLTAEKLRSEIKDLLSSKKRLSDMSQNLAKLAVPNSAEMIIEKMLEVAK